MNEKLNLTQYDQQGMSQEPLVGQTESLIGTAARPIYPFFLMKFEQSEANAESYIINLKVRAEIYNYIKTVYGKDEVVFYLDPLNGKMEGWTPSMLASFEFTQRLGLMSGVRTWIQNARQFLAKIVSSVQVPK